MQQPLSTNNSQKQKFLVEKFVFLHQEIENIFFGFEICKQRIFFWILKQLNNRTDFFWIFFKENLTRKNVIWMKRSATVLWYARHGWSFVWVITTTRSIFCLKREKRVFVREKGRQRRLESIKMLQANKTTLTSWTDKISSSPLSFYTFDVTFY